MEDKDLQERQEEEVIQSETAEEVEIPEEVDEITALKKQLEEKEEEAKKNQDLYLRALAEAENVRKRATREREEYVKYASLPLIKKLLSVVDDLDRALAAANAKQDYEALNKGVEMIAKSLHEVLENEGVEAIEAVGKPFDPQYHQPLAVEENTEFPADTVIEELQKGYILHGRVIRPSLVKVSN